MKDALKHGDTAVVSYSLSCLCTSKAQALSPFVVIEFNFTQLLD
jgi:hypothetical protein